MSQNSDVARYSAVLVGITEQISHPPFDHFIVILRVVQACFVLAYWAIRNCFTKLLGDAFSASFCCKYYPFFHNSIHWNKRWSSNLWVSRQVDLSILSTLFIRSINPFFFFLLSLVHSLPQTQNTWNSWFFINNWDKTSIYGHYFYQNIALNESNVWTNQHP